MDAERLNAFSRQVSVGEVTVVASSRNGVRTVAVTGDIDMQTAAALAEGLAAVSDHAGPLFIDMADVRFIDSSGLRVLLDFMATRPGPEPRVQIVNGSKPVLRLLDVTGLTEHFGV
jgi:anti-anti-sigma factor